MSWDEGFWVNRQIEGIQIRPGIADLGGGELLAVWESWGEDGSGAGIAFQPLRADGSLVATRTTVLNTTVVGEQNAPRESRPMATAMLWWCGRAASARTSGRWCGPSEWAWVAG
ncbi:MAG: hypothetical protein HC897_02935 [Thermoanaerobaculia bacterium]|nr:hypothetical protein [Thermoanaerobaculia bacterium]